ncbi:pyridoxamine 5'-phosphate oxidase family protein [Isoptericola variabilis]|uniref:Putative F420-dependent enzyme n=1 Tax=Isoptericola variabilis (strain 225) TaxID=743718 RepID=F6FSK6_ISOV2|nr:PPOX class F420-dependent oxidoreductase [Isoptericola variabilis]AEG44073.1 putative F420-dependent enzyme [Isoptericola variabilis 225]TWH31738.1 PPOX class probable F420-dependent enzyme [Isoptericola variabilis J7]
MIRLNPEQLVFVTERHLATLTTLRADGSPHVVPVAFTWDADAGLLRITTKRGSVKAANARRRLPDGSPPRAAVCQVEGGRWLTLEGTIEVSEDPDEVADAVARYARRYRQLEHDPERVVLRLTPDRVMASAYMA